MSKNIDNKKMNGQVAAVSKEVETKSGVCRDAVFGEFEIEVRKSYGAEGAVVHSGYLLYNMDEWDIPMDMDKLKRLHSFLGKFIEQEERLAELLRTFNTQ